MLRLLSNLVRTEEKTGPGHSNRQIFNGVVSALAGRGVAVISNFFAVPLTVKYLGAERYGVWVTLTSILAYITVFDLGIGSTAINGIAEALAKGDFQSAKKQVNTAYLTLLGMTMLLALGVWLMWPLISWPTVLGAKKSENGHEITVAAGVAIAIVLASFPLSATSRIMGACQKITLSNYWNSLGSFFALIAVIIVTRLKVGLPGLVIAVSGSTLLVGIGSTIWLYRHFDWLTLEIRDICWKSTRELLGTGLPFFAVQISGIILLQTDNLIIAQTLGASSVTPYSITWKLFSYASLLQVLALPTLWPAYADAFARVDFSWVRNAFRYNLLIAVGSTAAFVLLLIPIARPFIRIWAGTGAVPSFALVIGMGIWSIICSLSWCQSGLLGAAGKVKGQAIYSGVGAIVNLIASIALGRLYGLIGIILGTLLAYLLCIIIPQTVEVHRLLKRKNT